MVPPYIKGGDVMQKIYQIGLNVDLIKKADSHIIKSKATAFRNYEERGDMTYHLIKWTRSAFIQKAIQEKLERDS
jgi:hypothetical protein